MVRLATIAVQADPPAGDIPARAAELAGRLGLPLLAEPPDAGKYDLLLAVTQARLELRETAPPRASIWAEFAAGRVARRAADPGHGAAMLRRAVGFKRPPYRVLDATAGLARDAFLLAAAGCQVLAIERSPIIAALVEDGLARAARAGSQTVDRLTMLVADARRWLEAGLVEQRGVGKDAGGIGRTAASPECPPPDGRSFDAIYLDPMFPQRSKSALVKKEMRLCRLVAGEDEDAAELLDAARRVARLRVVVKRPAHAPPLAPESAFSIPGRTIRYDVYLPLSPGCAGSP